MSAAPTVEEQLERIALAVVQAEVLDALRKVEQSGWTVAVYLDGSGIALTAPSGSTYRVRVEHA